MKHFVTDLSEKQHQLTPHFKPAFLQGRKITFQFQFDEEAAFYLVADAAGFQFIAGIATTPTLTLYLDKHATCWQLLSGEQDGMAAFMEGRYRADGNILLTQLLLYLFRHEDPSIVWQLQD